MKHIQLPKLDRIRMSDSYHNGKLTKAQFKLPKKTIGGIRSF